MKLTADTTVSRTSVVRVGLMILLLVACGTVRGAVTDGCMEDLYNQFGQGGSLNCTANDIQIASVTNVIITDDGCAFPGDTVQFDARFEILLTAQTRYDIGVYLAQDGGDALTGSCRIDVLPYQPNNEACTAPSVPFACCTGAGTGICPFVDGDGTSNGTTNSDAFGYCSPDEGTSLSDPIQVCSENSDCIAGDTCEEFFGLQDTCGDIFDNQDPRNPIFHTITGITAVCRDTDRDGLLDLAACTSWRQAGANQLCLSPLAAYPGAPSKCRCDDSLAIPIEVPQTIEVVKNLVPSSDPGRFNLEIDGTQYAANVGDSGTTEPVAVSPTACDGGTDCTCSLGVDACSTDADCDASVCTESVDNQGNPLSCTSDADCGTEGTCAETEQGNSPKPCTDDDDCDPGDECLKSPSDVCLIDVCRDFAHTVSESGVATDLGTYDSSIVCIDRVGRCGEDSTLSCVTDVICDAASPGDTCDMTPTLVAECTNCTSILVDVAAPSDVVCTITNTPKCFDVDCDDGVDCTIGSCNPFTGECSYVADDTYCDDELFCNGVETCDPQNDCQGGTPPDCDDGVDCTSDTCDSSTDECSSVADDTYCDDELFCNGVETCDPQNDCQGGTPPDCDDGVDCTSDTCDSSTDECSSVADDTYCDDELFCNGVETCDPQNDCQGGTPPDCDDGVDCTSDTCDSSTDECSSVADDTYCDDELFCNGVETCDPQNDCQGGTPPDCDDGVDCTSDTCDSSTDECSSVADDTYCDDELFCNGVETCDPQNDCQGGTPPDCDDGVDCTSDTCDSSTDECSSVADDTYCDDELFCNGVETCDPQNDCQGGTPPDCDDGVDCTSDTCDSSTDECSSVADDTYCDDELFCNGVETCDPQNDCQGGTPPDCDDGVDCTSDTCDSSTDECSSVADDTYCDDELFCNGVETCDPQNDCQGGTPPDCDDGVDCTSDTCDSSTDECSSVADDTYCDDELFCNGVETCDPQNDCQGGTPPDCDDGVDCTSDTCDSSTDECSSVADDTYCDDELFCNGVETCDPQNDCQGGTPPNCDDGVDCTSDTCDSSTDECSSVADDTYCDDELFCNGVETCDPQNDCQEGTPPDCDDDDMCTDDDCDENLDACVNTPNDLCPQDCLTMLLTLNETDFTPGDLLVLEVDFVPNGIPLDLYIQWFAPDGTVLYLSPAGNLTVEPIPYLEDWGPEFLDGEVVLTRIFSESDSLDVYMVRGIATMPDSSLQIVRSNELSFTLSD